MADLRTVRMCALTAGLALAGCATVPVYGPIGPESNGFGYRDTRNADGSYTLLVVVNTGELAHEFWNRRAQELCGGSNFQKNIFRAQRPVVTVSGTATGPTGYTGYYTVDQYGAFILEGYLRCGPGAEPPQPPAPAQQPPPPTATPGSVP